MDGLTWYPPSKCKYTALHHHHRCGSHHLLMISRKEGVSGSSQLVRRSSCVHHHKSFKWQFGIPATAPIEYSILLTSSTSAVLLIRDSAGNLKNYCKLFQTRASPSNDPINWEKKLLCNYFTMNFSS